MTGSEVWKTRKKERILESAEMRMLRRIMGLPIMDRVSSDQIREEPS